MALLLGLVVLVLVLWAVGRFSTPDPKKNAALVRRIGGGAVLVFAGFLFFRGAIWVALPVAALGLGLVGWKAPLPGFNWLALKFPRRVSRVRSAFVEMELDDDTGAMRGWILAGPHDGAALDSLDVPTLVALMRGIDDDSRRLLVAYLDRRQPRWREYAKQDAGAGQGGGAATTSREMAEEEAYQILGLQPGASRDQIGRAHRSLMKKLHPDQGGSTYLAGRVNQAKEVLLRRHR
ncbi:MAG: DnaJ domain-containing protein [Xanthobacteraceae bacterium]|jgi:DnaJ-like protein